MLPTAMTEKTAFAKTTLTFEVILFCFNQQLPISYISKYIQLTCQETKNSALYIV